MCLLLKFIEELSEYLTGHKSISGNIIRKHSKNLEQLGDLSFPLNIKSWSQLINKSSICNNREYNTIFGYLSCSAEGNLNLCLESLTNKSKKWTLEIQTCKIKNNSDVHLYLNRSNLIELCIKDVLKSKSTYGLQHKCFKEKVYITCDDISSNDISLMNLTELRTKIVQDVASNVLNHLSDNSAKNEINVKLTLNSNRKDSNLLMCGSVLNETGVKDLRTTAAELYKKRALDMQLMAQHKYGIQIKATPTWIEYFEKLGRASVIIEMLQNRIHKTIKITLNNLQSSNKGPSFIFYNCARLSALLKEFDNKTLNKIYPDLPVIDEIDFTLLNQPEEWEMIYVYLLQFPMVISGCVCDIKTGTVNLHYLVSFLSNLSSLFSVYYRRVKILINAKEHLLPALFARIYFLKAVQQVFHTALLLLNIEPIKEM